MASTRARALQLGNTLGTEPFLVHGISAENPVNQKLTEMHMAGHRVRLDSNLLRVRLHMSSVHGIYQRDPVNWITRTCRPRGSTSQYCTQMMCDFVCCGVLRRGKCSFGEMKPVLRGVRVFQVWQGISMCVTAFASSLKACSNLGERSH